MRPRALSVLDLTPVGRGSDPVAAVAGSVELARLAERLGYRRIWFAEHHNIPTLASSAPEVLIGHVASRTSTIRVGAGGIMLPNHSPLHVAESFRLLEALHPGRIDLGVGRAPGTDQLTAFALRRHRLGLGEEDFGEQLVELLGFLGEGFEPDHPFARIEVSPVGTPPPEPWVLGSSAFGGRLAAHLGLGFAFAHHIDPGPAASTMRAYRVGFRPVAGRRPEPWAVLAVSVVCAPTDAEAERLAAPLDLAMVRLAQGRPLRPQPSVEEALDHDYSPGEEDLRRRNRLRYVVGGIGTVADRLSQLVSDTGADELMVTTMVNDPAARSRTYEMLATALGPASAGGQEC